MLWHLTLQRVLHQYDRSLKNNNNKPSIIQMSRQSLETEIYVLIFLNKIKRINYELMFYRKMQKLDN